MEIDCANPTLLFSPTMSLDICRADYLYCFGRLIHLDKFDYQRIIDGESFNNVFGFPYVDFKSLPVAEKYEICENVYFLDSEASEIIPVFVCVPCNKCSICISKKIYSYVQRAQMATEQAHKPSWFVTLTYNDVHCPYDGVSKRHIQLFKKRVKRNIELYFKDYRGGLYSSDIKFIITSEYTPETHRPHYHCFIIGFPRLCVNDTTNRYETTHFFQYCWRESVRLSNGKFESFSQYKNSYPLVFNRPPNYDPYSLGFVNVKQTNSHKVCSYILKYSFKNSEDVSNVPDGKSDNFRSVSCNLGVQFVEQFKSDILKSLDGSFSFVSIFNQQVKNCKLCNYYVKKLFPSWHSKIPAELKRMYLNVRLALAEIADCSNIPNSMRCAAIATQLFINDHFPFLEHFPLAGEKRPLTNRELSDRLDFVLSTIPKMFTYSIDFEELKRLAIERSFFMSMFKKVDYVLHQKKCSEYLSILKNSTKLK